MRRADRKAGNLAILDLFARVTEADTVGYETGRSHPVNQHIPVTPYDMWWPDEFDKAERLTRYLLIDHWRVGFARGRAVRVQELKKVANTDEAPQ